MVHPSCVYDLLIFIMATQTRHIKGRTRGEMACADAGSRRPPDRGGTKDVRGHIKTLLLSRPEAGKKRKRRAQVPWSSQLHVQNQGQQAPVGLERRHEE